MKSTILAQRILRFATLTSGSADQTAILTVSNTSFTVTTGASTTQFAATGLGTTNTWLGRTVVCKTATNAANVGVSRVVTGYVVASSQFTTAAFPANVSVDDTFQILADFNPGAKKCFIFGCSHYVAGALNVQSAPIVITTPGGYRMVVASSAGITGDHIDFAAPLVVPLDSGDITVVVDSTTTWAAANEFFIRFAGE